jgi:hypothetical protein
MTRPNQATQCSVTRSNLCFPVLEGAQARLVLRNLSRDRDNHGDDKINVGRRGEQAGPILAQALIYFGAPSLRHIPCWYGLLSQQLCFCTISEGEVGHQVEVTSFSP